MISNAGPLEVLITLFVIVWAVAWTLLPFALFGIKPILRELLSEMKRANELRERHRPVSA